MSRDRIEPSRDYDVPDEAHESARTRGWPGRRTLTEALTPKVPVGDSGDASEAEADAAADRALDRSKSGGHGPAPLLSSARGSAAQARADAGGDLGPAVTVPGGTGAALTAPLRAQLERGFGQDLGAVRVHADAAAAASAADLGAAAFTVGQEIYFGHGRFAPDSAEGEGLLAHEVAHTLQASGGGAPVLRRKPAHCNSAAVPNGQHKDVSRSVALTILQHDEAYLRFVLVHRMRSHASEVVRNTAAFFIATPETPARLELRAAVFAPDQATHPDGRFGGLVKLLRSDGVEVSGVPETVQGFRAPGDGIITVRRSLDLEPHVTRGDEDLIVDLVHETQHHAAHVAGGAAPGGTENERAWQSFRTEHSAYWVDGQFAHLPATPPALGQVPPPTHPAVNGGRPLPRLSPRSFAILTHLLSGCAYPALAAAYDSSRNFRGRVHSHDGVQSANPNNDPVIDDLMSSILSDTQRAPLAWSALSMEQRTACRENPAVEELIKSATSGGGAELAVLGLVLGDGLDGNDFDKLWVFSARLGWDSEELARKAAQELPDRARRFASRHTAALGALLRRARTPGSFAARLPLSEVVAMVGP